MKDTDRIDAFLLKWEKFNARLLRLVFWPTILFFVFVSGVMIGSGDIKYLKHMLGGILAMIFLKLLTAKVS